MKLSQSLLLIFISALTLNVVIGKAAPNAPIQIPPVPAQSDSANPEILINLTDFGAVGNGSSDDGPALQAALNALGAAGGGTLFVPAGRYAIVTPVHKDFTGLASSVTILGVESLTPVPPPNSSGQILTRGLDLVSEFAPRTGELRRAIDIVGLQTFLIRDISFIGTPGVYSDAYVTLALNNIREATIQHCEFYGLSSLADGGSIVQSVFSDLNLDQSVFLGCTANSGVYGSVVQNLEWKGIEVSNTVFVDYGQRAELYGKMGYAAPFSWVSIGNAAAPKSDSPRREAVVRQVFFDEGGFFGLSSTPYRYLPASAPIDLLYITGLYMNVSNLGTSGNYVYGPQRVLIEDAHYGWSHNADSAINLLSVGNAILDQVECGASADRIRADSATGKLTVIDSVYNHLDSLAQTTRVITTNAPDEDPVQYVRQKFDSTLGHAPDPAAHFYWSDQILQCIDNLQCTASKKTALANYLASAPQEKFTLSGRLVDEDGAPMAGIQVALGGSQTLTTETNANGEYQISNLPTSGNYTVTPSRRHYTFSPATYAIITPANDQVFNSAATLNHHAISGTVSDSNGNALANVVVTLSGSQSMIATTGTNGRYLFEDLPAGGNYTVTPRKISYIFSPANHTLNDLDSDKNQNFSGTFKTYKIAGILVGANNQPIPGAAVTLSGPEQLTTTSDSGGGFAFSDLPSERNYTVTPTLIGFSFDPPSRTYNSLAVDQYHVYVATYTPGNRQSTFEFNAASYTVSEQTRTLSVTVTRTGDTSIAGEVVYSATDGSADQRGDVIPIIGRLSFAPGETSRSFIIFITDDGFVEGNENITLELSDLLGGNLGNNGTATLNITDNDSSPTSTNPIDGADFFVRQQYRDFLNRPADADGLAFWTNQILTCGTDTACIADRRMNVSGAFFLSIEFQQTGFLVYRLYQASFAHTPQHLDEFLLDTRTIGEGVIVNAPGWQDLLETNTTEFIESFVARTRFIEAYPTNLSPAEFVNLLNGKTGGALPPDEVAAAIAEFQGAGTSESVAARARALRRIAGNATFSQRQLNPAFVLMQYFGYLQRNPNETPDTNLDGYNFWLRKLEQFGGDFRRAEMVQSFLVSREYRARFGAP